MKKTIALVILLLLAILRTYATDYRFRYYTVEDGLSNNAVRYITQDKKGYIWTLTPNGLTRFSGNKFKTFNYTADSSFLVFDDMISLGTDSKGNIWIGGDAKIYFFNPLIEKIEHFEPELETQLKSYVFKIIEDSHGNLWFATRSNGIICYNPQNNTYTQLHSKQIEPQLKLREDELTDIIIDAQGVLWVSYVSSPYLYCYDIQNGVSEHIALPNETVLEYNNGWLLTDDSFGNIWGVRKHTKMFCLNKENKNFRVIEPQNKECVTNRVLSIIEQKPGVLMIGGINGIIVYNMVQSSFHNIKCDPINFGLNDYFIHALFKDREGGVWAGSFYGGLNYLSPIDYGFELQKDVANGNTSRFIVSSFCEDPYGQIWVGSDNEGVIKYDPIRKTVKAFPVLDRDKKTLNVHALYADSSYLYVGAFAAGLRKLTYNGTLVRHYRPGHNITALYKDGEQRHWLGSTSNIALYNAKRDMFIDCFDNKQNIRVSAITGDDQGYTWFSTLNKGLYYCKPGSLVPEKFIMDSTGFITDRIRSICFHNGKLWVGTDGDGLFYIEQYSHKLIPCSHTIMEDKVDINFISASGKYLWITTNRGLYRYALDNGDIACYDQEDGLQGKVFNIGAGLKTSGGRIYIGGNNGFNYFDPGFVSQNHYPAPIVFTGLRVFNQAVEISEKGLLTQSIDDQRELYFRANQNTFSLDFSALTFCAPSKVFYRYRLSGTDNQWIDIDQGTPPTVSYANLPPGNYSLQVEAFNSLDSLSRKSASLDIIILPPWWASWWMRILYVSLFLAIIAVLFWWFNNKERMRREHHFNERERKSKEDLLESKIRIFQEIAHEIRTPVTLISAPAEEMLEHADLNPDMQENLETICSNSRHLVGLMDQVLDFNKNQSIHITDALSDIDIWDYIRVIADRFKGEIKHRNITYNATLVGQSLVVRINAEAFDKIISNIISNALKYTRSSIDINVTVNQASGFFTVSVKDNGDGLEDKDKIFELFYRSQKHNESGIKGFGIGLAVVKMLMDKMQGTIKVDSEPNEFTCFELTFPCVIAQRNDLGTYQDDAVIETDEENEECLLLVEDHEMLLNFLSKSLSKKYRIITASNGEIALEILKTKRIDVVVSDVMMPRMDGWTLCNHIKNDIKINHIPVILLTACTDTQSKIKALENGADVYVEKPVVMAYLKAQISGLLEKRKRLQEKYSKMSLVEIHKAQPTDNEDPLIAKLNIVVENNLSNSEFSMDEIAKEMGISRSAMYAKIKAVTGLTPNDFVRMIRLRKAAELLTSNAGYKINEVCYLVGFSTPSYFSKCFQQQFGVLPKDLINTIANQELTK
ncbi:MAG: hybrid sensor histidine kinase/response regulator transcription factor [Marinifilaceae bacterium]